MDQPLFSVVRFLVRGLERVCRDIPQERLFDRPPGNGHPPVWVLGHLAVVGEFGLASYGIPPRNAPWGKTFGPGSTDQISFDALFTKLAFLESIQSAYPRLAQEWAQAQPDFLNKPHGLALLEKSPIQTVGELHLHVLTSHFSFHTAQLSQWRRASGLPALF